MIFPIKQLPICLFFYFGKNYCQDICYISSIKHFDQQYLINLKNAYAFQKVYVLFAKKLINSFFRSIDCCPKISIEFLLCNQQISFRKLYLFIIINTNINKMGGEGSRQKAQKQVGNNKNMFNFIKIVGKGGFGRVWKVSNKKTKLIYAMKIIDKAKVITKKSVNSVMNERELLAKINNPFIVNMICAFQDRQNLYLLIDYLDSGDLRYYINRNYNFDQAQIKFVIQCIMEGLRYLHDQNIIHRDIKPENIIFDKMGYCRITDMGIARHWKMENSNETSGTPGYMAPQVLLRQNHSFCADYFAVGIIAYELVMSKRPYNGRNRKQIRDDMLARQAKIPSTVKTVSKQCIDFINKMIQRVARKRLGFNGVHEILQHPWLAMGKQSRKNFELKKTVSPIAILEINHHSSLQESTQPDQVWKENIILLKRPQIQEMFANYDFDGNQNEPDSKQLEKTSSSFNKQQSNIMPPTTTSGRFFAK